MIAFFYFFPLHLEIFNYKTQMPQTLVPKSTEKQTNHFYDIWGCLSTQHVDITVTGNAEILSSSYKIEIERGSRKQKKTP